MWTDDHRETYRRGGTGFPSNLTDAEWGVLKPLIPDATPGGRPRKTDEHDDYEAQGKDYG